MCLIAAANDESTSKMYITTLNVLFITTTLEIRINVMNLLINCAFEFAMKDTLDSRDFEDTQRVQTGIESNHIK